MRTSGNKPLTGIARYWMFTTYYLKALCYYLLLGAYFICVYPRQSWRYLSHNFGRNFWAMVCRKIDEEVSKRVEAFWKRMLSGIFTGKK